LKNLGSLLEKNQTLIGLTLNGSKNLITKWGINDNKF